MGVGAFAEPLVVVTLLFGGAWFNRTKAGDDLHLKGWVGTPLETSRKRSDDYSPRPSVQKTYSESSECRRSGSCSSSSTYAPPIEPSTWRTRNIKLLAFRRTVSTPNTIVFRDRLLSRLLRKFPFLVEAWYWALIYWIYQSARAIAAVNLVEGTVHVARKHALQVIHLEQAMGIFVEGPVQEWFMARPTLMHWINRVYSFIHIPGTILFLVVLYYLTTTRKRRALAGGGGGGFGVGAGPGLYEARRRTMALCNLLAFVVFTLWPCMPPRLLSDPEYQGEDASEAKSYGFVDTVHSAAGESSVWTTNKFCNQYAAMPSLHFGYSFLIGLTIATIPIPGLRPTSWKRLVIVAFGMSYPSLILAAIVATANHFVLDAVLGAVVCAIAWNANDVLLNLMVLEDYFLWVVRIHKPVNWSDPDTAVEHEWEPLAAEAV